MRWVLLLIFVAFATNPPKPVDDFIPAYDTVWFDEPVDHMNRDAGMFKVRVLV
jgi:hypothetical protein